MRPGVETGARVGPMLPGHLWLARSHLQVTPMSSEQCVSGLTLPVASEGTGDREPFFWAYYVAVL